MAVFPSLSLSLSCVCVCVQELFRGVKCHECVRFPSARTDGDKAANAPSVWATVEQFNCLSRVTVATILQATSHDSVTREHTPHARARVIGQWLQVALHCRKLKNFSSLKAVLSGLDSQPIHRLKRTWGCLSRYMHTDRQMYTHKELSTHTHVHECTYAHHCYSCINRHGFPFGLLTTPTAYWAYRPTWEAVTKLFVLLGISLPLPLVTK